jgi:hypothetical protein
MQRVFATAVQFKRGILQRPGPARNGGIGASRSRAQRGRLPWHNVCFVSIRLGVTRFQAGSIRGLKAAVSAEDAVRNMDNNGGTRARTFTEMA